MPEDEDSTLQHIPAQFGVPAHDFNWPWYWRRVAAQEAARAKRREDEDRLQGFVFVFVGLVLAALLYGYLCTV